MAKAPVEARVVFWSEELVEALGKLSATGRKVQNSAVKFGLSQSPPGIKSEGDGKINRQANELPLNAALNSGTVMVQ